jgi:deoxyuridine 5'-triphosphate nucleotidohydrolase
MSNPMNHPSAVLQVKKLRPEAILPTRGSEWSAGYDLSSAEHLTIAAGARAVVKTALAIACPSGTYGRVAPRSGLTVKHGIHVGAGVIDADYRGEVGVVLFNLGDADFVIAPGDRIAQLVLEQIVLAPVTEVEELDATVRGAGGFGSTGVTAVTKKAKVDPEGATRITPTTGVDDMNN